MTRVCALAIATAACVILPGALVYEIIRTAAARRFGATIALTVFLIIWATASAGYYPRVCADIFRQSPLVRSLQGQWQRMPDRRQPGGGGGVLLPRFVAQSRQEDRGNTATVRREAQNVRGRSWVVGDGTLLAPYGGWQRNGVSLAPLLFVARRRQIDHGGMEALPREPPTARVVVAGDTVALPHERRRDDGEPPFELCVVCLCDVEKVETAARLPAFLHMFHRHCIDQWLHQHGRSTCPICRCDAFAAPLPREHMGVTVFSFFAPAITC